MPAGKPSESNAMLYTVITFVALFLIAATCAVIFYLKAEDFKTQHADLDRKMNEFATGSELNSIRDIVGRSLPNESGSGTMSALGTMETYLDEMVSAITGQVPADKGAGTKVNDAKIEINETMKVLVEDRIIGATEGVDLVELIGQLKSDLDSTRAGQRQLAQRYQTLQDDFDAAEEEGRFKEKQLIEEKNRFQATADEVQGQYDDLRKLMEESAEDQVQNLMDKLEAEQTKLKQRNAEYLAMQDTLTDTEEQLQLALETLKGIKGGMNIEIAAFKADARIVRIENEIVYLNIGSGDHVYPGLTFSVYDRSTPIPEDGKGKAEIEIFEITESVSAAKITSSSKKNPIVSEDIVANLIWDSKTSNRFVISGEFDFDGDGTIDAEGKDKVTRLIRNWGGRIVDRVTIETDFVVLGNRPIALARPSSEDIELDPRMEDKYEASLQKGRDYDGIFNRAGSLSVPVINQQRFLHLIGYHSLASKSTPF